VSKEADGPGLKVNPTSPAKQMAWFFMALTNAICHTIITIMVTHLTIDKAGRVVIPKTLRDRLSLEAGDSLEIEHSDGEIVLRPVRNQSTLVKHQGVWVLQTGYPLPGGLVNDLLNQVREDRDLINLSSAE
jgi:AbrB family looped-hinge helix DNA binding protein